MKTKDIIAGLLDAAHRIDAVEQGVTPEQGEAIKALSARVARLEGALSMALAGQSREAITAFLGDGT